MRLDGRCAIALEVDTDGTVGIGLIQGGMYEVVADMLLRTDQNVGVAEDTGHTETYTTNKQK